MTDVCFTVPLVPIGKARARTVRLPNGQSRTYTPKKTADFESTLALMAQAYLPSKPLEGPVRVDIVAVLPRPKRLMRKKDPSGMVWAPTRPDADNIRKAVLDALSLHWRDDAQVVDGRTVKVYAEKEGKPRVEIRVRTAEELPDAPVSIGALKGELALYPSRGDW